MTGRKDTTMMTRDIPLYLASPEYAREHNELDQYRASLRANQYAARDIEKLIAEHFDGYRLPRAAARLALIRHGEKRISLLLALTLIDKAYDGRFSRDNVSWAESFGIAERYPHFLDTHRLSVQRHHDASRRP